MKEITLDEVYDDFDRGGYYPKGSTHGIKILYKYCFETFDDFCEYVKRSGYRII